MVNIKHIVRYTIKMMKIVPWTDQAHGLKGLFTPHPDVGTAAFECAGAVIWLTMVGSTLNPRARWK